MSKFKIKKLPPIKLTDLLRKRKTNLKNFISSAGIAAYTTLLLKCEKMGVSAPTEEEFKLALGTTVSSPQEGVVVLDPPALLAEDGHKIAVDSFGPTEQANSAQQDQKKDKKNSKKIVIDESIFLTSSKEDDFKKSEMNLGDAEVTEDNLDTHVSKLSSLKKTK